MWRISGPLIMVTTQIPRGGVKIRNSPFESTGTSMSDQGFMGWILIQKRLGVLRVCRQRLDLAADYEVQGQDAVDGTAAQYVPSSRLHHERFGAKQTSDLSVQSWCPVGGVLPRNGGSGENVLVESGGDLGRREAFEHRCRVSTSGIKATHLPTREAAAGLVDDEESDRAGVIGSLCVECCDGGECAG